MELPLPLLPPLILFYSKMSILYLIYNISVHIHIENLCSIINPFITRPFGLKGSQTLVPYVILWVEGFPNPGAICDPSHLMGIWLPTVEGAVCTYSTYWLMSYRQLLHSILAIPGLGCTAVTKGLKKTWL